jgi:hypothetical protein
MRAMNVEGVMPLPSLAGRKPRLKDGSLAADAAVPNPTGPTSMMLEGRHSKRRPSF